MEVPATFPRRSYVVFGVAIFFFDLPLATSLVAHGKKSRVVENRIEQCCAARIVQCCQQYCSALLHPIAGWIQVLNIVVVYSVLLKTLNNVGTTLFNPVFKNLQQTVFLRGKKKGLFTVIVLCAERLDLCGVATLFGEKQGTTQGYRVVQWYVDLIIDNNMPQVLRNVELSSYRNVFLCRYQTLSSEYDCVHMPKFCVVFQCKTGERGKIFMNESNLLIDMVDRLIGH